MSTFLRAFFLIGVLSSVLIGSGILSGCASNNQKAPCPNYGFFCSKTPINSWSSK